MSVAADHSKTEGGFGSGLRAKLAGKDEEPRSPAEAIAAADPATIPDIELLRAELSASQEMASFVRAIVQADQLGISLGRILRIQAGDSRLKRQLLAEEKAMKAPIKMLFPTVIFIFPAMFLVVLGPAFLNLSSFFKF